MAIAITEGCMDGIGNSTICKHELTQNNALVRDAIVQTRSSEETIPFHRHCQKTICSAYGPNGNGLTWNILYRGGENDLANIQSYVSQSSSGSEWYNYFTGNEDNITQDLRSILELINIIAGQVANRTTWILEFKDCGEKQVGTNIINPWSGDSQTYTFNNIGRFLTLQIDEQELKFHTIKPGITGYDEDKLSVEFPKNDLTINFNGIQIANIAGIYMPDDEIVNINQDFNKLPTNEYVGTPSVDGSTHVYRYHTTTTPITPSFMVDNKYISSESSSTSPIIEWEFHIRNDRESGNITVNTPSITVGEYTNYFSKVTPLTDQMYVEPGKTNVYVFRIDTHSTTKALTYSLAYVY